MNIKDQLSQLLQSGKIELISTQGSMGLPVIERIYKKMKIKLMFDGIQVHGNAIINGHHRYLASLLANYELEQVPSIRSQAKTDVEWANVKLVDEDWDTSAKINHLNRKDAEFNSMTLNELLEKIR